MAASLLPSLAGQIFGAGGLGGAAAGGAAAAAGPLAAFGPVGLGLAALTTGAQIFGGIQQQNAQDRAITQAEEGFVRNFSVSDLMAERDKARQLSAMREGYNFMRNPAFQQSQDEAFTKDFMLAGKLNPYLTGMTARFS
jgi:hypothetical protein